MTNLENNLNNLKGYFGEFGGSFVPEVVQKALDEAQILFDSLMQKCFG